MSELLLELFYEEVPALMQKDAELGYIEIFHKIFQKNNIQYKSLETFITPRRITLYACEMIDVIPSYSVEFKGPSVNASESALDGFCRNYNIRKQDLAKKIIKDREFYFYTKTVDQVNVCELLPEILSNAIKEYVWPKTMRWNDYDLQSIRPLKNILCLFNSQVLPFKFAHLIANNKTFGHRFMGAQNISVNNFEEYNAALKENFVVLSREERKGLIKNQIHKIASVKNLKLREDERLLEEVAGLVEFPQSLLGRIDTKFLKLPKEVLISSIRTHQKYFNLFDEDGNFAPYFIFVSNLKSDNPEIIVGGNQRVLSARLEDALYFYEEDLKKPFKSNDEALKDMMFHTRLGNMHEKVHRICKICRFLDPENVELHIAAKVCKNDLISYVVTEFPELQGIMGYYYAINENLPQESAAAIYSHYKPLGPESEVPVEDAGLLAIADKIDSLCGLMIANEAPSGSKDPHALRRTALGIIRIIIENHLEIDIKELIHFTCNLYGTQDKKIEDIILAFIEERAKHRFKEDFDHNIIQASIDLNFNPNLIRAYHILRAISDFLNNEEGRDSLAAYKRVNNILGPNKVIGNVNEKLLNSDHEKSLYEHFIDLERQIDIVLGCKHYEQALGFLKYLNEPIKGFFDNVTVNDSDQKLMQNRLIMLQNIKDMFHKIARFDLL